MVSERADKIDELKSSLGELVTTVEELMTESPVGADHELLNRVRAALEEARDLAEMVESSGEPLF
jgi:ElaB/YqjD/DUF883 family membrane-anchored ribosome-binding protein